MKIFSKLSILKREGNRTNFDIFIIFKYICFLNKWIYFQRNMDYMEKRYCGQNWATLLFEYIYLFLYEKPSKGSFFE